MTKQLKGAPKGHEVTKSIGHIELTDDHKEILEGLRHLRASIEGMEQGTVKEQRANMDRVIAWLEQHIEHHTKREDAELYRLIERHKGNHYTLALRVEHRFIYRAFDELRVMAAQPIPDCAAFTHRFDNLTGLFEAHFEAEELVLFPLVDELKERGLFPTALAHAS